MKKTKRVTIAVSLCPYCYCATKTIKGKCGKCGKGEEVKKYEFEDLPSSGEVKFEDVKNRRYDFSSKDKILVYDLRISKTKPIFQINTPFRDEERKQNE